MSSKSKQGRLLSQFIRRIAEETEFVLGEDGEDDRMVSNAEILARKIWRLAKGYTEVIVTDTGSREVVHPPDLKMAAIIMDRMEGRCGTVQEDEVIRPNTMSKVSDQGKKRIAQAGGLDVDS
jgi:hypothetical protein